MSEKPAVKEDGPSDRLASLMNLAKGRIPETGADVATPQAIGAALEWCYGGKLVGRQVAEGSCWI
jgi:hypothetical protein